MSDFNPSEHNIEDVNAYLEKNPDQLQAVLSAEESGKNRPTLVKALQEQASKIATPVSAPAVTVEPSPTPTNKVFNKEYEVTSERGYRVKK